MIQCTVRHYIVAISHPFRSPICMMSTALTLLEREAQVLPGLTNASIRASPAACKSPGCLTGDECEASVFRVASSLEGITLAWTRMDPRGVLHGETSLPGEIYGLIAFKAEKASLGKPPEKLGRCVSCRSVGLLSLILARTPERSQGWAFICVAIHLWPYIMVSRMIHSLNIQKLGKAIVLCRFLL